MGNFHEKIIIFFLIGIPVVLAQDVKSAAPEPALTADQVIQRLMNADRNRFRKLHEYTSVRHYSMNNHRFKKSARMKVKVSFQHPDQFEYEVLDEEGPRAVRNQVFRKMLKSEQEALDRAEREATLVSVNNYEFELLREEDLDGRRNYVLSAIPKTKNKFLFRGEVWIDADDFAVSRIEGAPAQKPSFWVIKTHFVHRNIKVDEFWVPHSNHSQTDVLIFGSTDVEIHYGDYGMNSLAQR